MGAGRLGAAGGAGGRDAGEPVGIADPANPDRTPAEVAYPAAGTPNAAVSLLLARLDGTSVEVDADRAAFPYLVTACWTGEHDPLVLVQSRDQRRCGC